jgi:mannan endo-1,4-beta-mannosidase
MKMKSLFKIAITVVLITSTAGLIHAGDPVNPNATPEAKALLDLFYRIAGKYTLTGQHNYPNTKDRNTRFAAEYIGQTPAIWSTDMGFAKKGDYDSYLARPDIVKEAIRQHKKGSIITICWHAVPPTADEPVTFQPRGPKAPDSLASVQGRLLDEQFKELLTPGTRLYKRWAAQVDSIAVYLKILQDAHVPVLWRPYHEMNGDWFWWGGRVGENSTADLYRQLYDRMVNYHKLNNLVWVWSVDRPSTPIRKFSNFYPGNEYLDILALDVYGSDFNQAYYDSLMVLSKGKPIVLGEVGNPPTLDILKNQPNWGYWVIWAGMVRNLTKKQHQELVNDPRILSQEDPAYLEVISPYRKACGLPLLPLKEKYPVNFSGHWIFNEDKSEVGNSGVGNVPYEMKVYQDGDLLDIKKVTIVEWGDDQISNEEILLDGSEMRSEFFNSPRISKANWNEANQSLVINSVTKFERGGRSFERKSSEEWSLLEGGKVLKIVQTSTGYRGEEVKLTLIYDKN